LGSDLSNQNKINSIGRELNAILALNRCFCP
jgi:hypothetical protein